MLGRILFGLGMLGIFLQLIIGAISILAFVFWILMLVDCVKRKFKDSEKIVWILVLIFTGIIGALIYYFVVKYKNR
jgi:cytochrome c biogenesis factor